MVPKTVLVIGAAPDIRQQLRKALPAPEWSVREAPDNAAALQLIESEKFDVILTDDATSAQQDLEFLRRLRRAHPHTRVIILTDESTPDDVMQAIREGAFSYFTRPFSLVELWDAVRNAVNEPVWDDGIEIVSAKPDWIRLIARCDVQTAERVLRFVTEMIDLPRQEKQTVGWALRELLMNAIEYGGKFDPNQYVELSYMRTKRAVSCRLKDPGEGFSFEEIHHAAVSNPEQDPLRHLVYRESENRRPGGFGILLSRNMVDELLYNDKGNEVVLIKYTDQIGSGRS